MNLLLVERHEITGSEVVLRDRRAEHLRKVLRAEPDRILRAGIVGGGVGTARVVRIDAREAVLELDIPDRPAPTSEIDLVVALPRPQALHRLLQTAAAMGVGRLALVNAWRVEKSFFHTPSLEPDKVRRHLLLGAEQGMTTHLPEVSVEKLFVPFVERLKQAAQDGAAQDGEPPLYLVAHPETDLAIEDVFFQEVSPRRPRRIVLAVGAEGGWIDREIRTLGEAGFRAVSLGEPILRVETAVAGALCQLELLRRLTRRGASEPFWPRPERHEMPNPHRTC